MRQRAAQARRIHKPYWRQLFQRGQLHLHRSHLFPVVRVLPLGHVEGDVGQRDRMDRAILETHLGPLCRPEAQPGDNRRQRHHPYRQHFPARQVIEERTLAGLEPAKDGDLNAAARLKLMAARGNLRAESVQLQFHSQGAELIKNAVVLMHSLPSVNGSRRQHAAASNKFLSSTLIGHPLVAGDLPAPFGREFLNQGAHLTLQAFDLRGLRLAQPITQRRVRN